MHDLQHRLRHRQATNRRGGPDRGLPTAVFVQGWHRLLPILAAGIAMTAPPATVAYDQEYYVNERHDAPDFNLLDGVPDAQEFEPGLQTTLRSALMQAAYEGGTTRIALGSGVYTNSNQQFISGDITLHGQGREETVIDGSHADRVISVGNISDRTIYNVHIEGLTIRNGALSLPSGLSSSGVGILNYWSIVTLSNVLVEGNVAAGSNPQYSDSAGIKNLYIMTLHGCTVQSNTANGVAGGIYNSAHGRMDIYDSTIRGNQGASGGGIYNGSICTINGSTLSGNRAGAEGGAIYNAGGSAISELTNSTLSDNYAGLRGGAIHNWYGGCGRSDHAAGTGDPRPGTLGCTDGQR